MAPAPTKTDRKDEVLAAAAHLFVANGYMSTTMDDIAAAVSLNKGTLYYYYDGKASILFDIIFRMEEGRLQMARGQAPVEDPSEGLRQFIEDSAVYIIDNPVSSRISSQESPFLDMWLSEEQLNELRRCHDEFQGYLIRYIDQGVEQQLFAGIDARVAVQGVTAMLSWLPRWSRVKGSLTKEEVARQIAAMVLGGLLGQVLDTKATARKSNSRRSATQGTPDVAAGMIKDLYRQG